MFFWGFLESLFTCLVFLYSVYGIYVLNFNSLLCGLFGYLFNGIQYLLKKNSFVKLLKTFKILICLTVYDIIQITSINSIEI